ncbi:acyltransferase family protein [Amphritea sp. 1_MG-2023]|uniref:acyltransferase family protein n=1 Tax=Amphritea sp. 1_MG-2023 TaxID=3062670 RepID=UPI0026E3BFAB|nr:acyltransferase family protein [Amphritea sp. 1_MG-2023]MDO6565145.1 acyltransferase family protein [Amphritea sp. 1_MG-2023]
MQLSKSPSDRIELLRFPLIISIVFIHSYDFQINFSGGSSVEYSPSQWVIYFMDAISQGFARVAVPIFFLLSGFLFFLKFSATFFCYKQKLISRFHSLVFPFLFWNILVLAIFAIAQNISYTQSYFSGRMLISDFSTFDLINAIIGLNQEPIAYQFWFIRDFIAVVLLTPAIYFLLKTFPFITLLILKSIWFFNLWSIYIPSIDSLLFFYIGAFFAHKKIDLFFSDIWGRFCFSVFLILVVLDTLSKGLSYNPEIHKLALIFGILGTLFITKFFLDNKYLKDTLIYLGTTSFFVFATHEPLLITLKKLTFKLLPPASDFELLGIFLLLPIITILICLAAYALLNKIIPSLLLRMSGGR